MKIDALRAFLSSISPGPIVRDEDKARLIELLRSCWEEIDGNEAEGMAAYKLERMEQPEWEPPFLRFLIERHGGTVHGSTRAEVHQWEVNVLDGSAHCNPDFGMRHRHPRQPALNVDRLADEVVGLIMQGKDDPSLKWSRDHSRVTLRIGKVIPEKSGFKETVAARRRQLGDAIEKRLQGQRWVKVPGTSPHTYERSSQASGLEIP